MKKVLIASLVASLGFSVLTTVPVAVAEEITVKCPEEIKRQFDFWVGEWDVHDGDGNLVGENSVRVILNGCAISENWRSARDNRGVSYNFFDAAESKWHQTWVDDSGGALYLDGGFDGNAMVLRGYRPAAEGDGSSVLHEISYTPTEDGRVIQHWRASKTEGNTWKDVFLGYYSKKSSLASRPSTSPE